MTRDEFIFKYAEVLRLRIIANRQNYAYGPELAPGVAAKMVAAIEEGTFHLSRDDALWKLCEKVGIAKPSAQRLRDWYKENIK